ncbi:hypothetical protein SeLEV6574_g02503 [Synchytrium endobioticum]|uniref:Uncharacterized protein n=1 Tax=Synchytrium endobioticum TaxID=286115 RepID=A0A507D8M3_9FUNG|nr:hypothetical protein SeLEV6574_g02503 [Synchytrium endobioticum]
MVRPTRHRGQYIFNVLDKSLALRKMRLNADDLVVLAVESGNDYVSNIPGKAIVTNVKIFQKIKEKGDLSKEEMLKKPFAQPNGSAPSPTRRLGLIQEDADKAKRGELDRVLEGIVNMVDESMGHKLSGGKKVIVAIGMGDFSSAKSRHVMFTRGYLVHDERPAYLKPPSKDKNGPMKRKADEGGTSRAGPSKSRKTR